VYADIVEELAGQPDDLAPPPADEPWTTFAGDSARNRLLSRAPGRLARLRPLDGPPRQIPLNPNARAPGTEGNDPAIGVLPPGQLSQRAGDARWLAFHPVLVGEEVLVTDGWRVQAFNLHDGSRHIYELPGGRNEPVAPDAAHTLTVVDDLVFARLGVQGLGPLKRGQRSGEHNSYLTCLQIQRDAAGKCSQLVPRWTSSATAPVMLEGAPVVHAGRVFIAASQFDESGQVQASISAYDAATGAIRWQQPVCKAPEGLKDGERRYRHHLLTMAGSNVVYCSHSGAIVALDAATGRRVWAVRYPGRGPRAPEGAAVPRGLAPCLYSEGRVFVAPQDLDHILCLDAATGRVLWESAPVEVVHLLGVARGRLIFTWTDPHPHATVQPPSGIRALDAMTGDDLRSWAQPAAGSLATFGRGVLAGDYVLWPTVSGLWVLNQEDGDPPASLDWNCKCGNLAVGNGCLVVAGKDTLYVYASEAPALPQRRAAAARPGARAVDHYRLARAEEDAGHGAQALKSLREAERLAEPGSVVSGVPLRERARSRRHELLLDLAEQARHERRWEEAAGQLAQAAAPEFPVAARLQALQRQAAVWTAAAQPSRAVAAWQNILDNDDLRRGLLFLDAGIPRRAAAVAAERIAALLAAHGTGIYEGFEQKARTQLKSAVGSGQLETLQAVTAQYANASATGPALLRLAALHEQAGRYGAAADTYRRLLRHGGREADRVRALVGLAQGYERQQCWQAARGTWEQLARAHGDQTVPELDRSRPVRDLAAAHLQVPASRIADGPGPPNVFLPLTRTWHAALTDGSDSGELFLAPDVASWSAVDAEALFLTHGERLLCRSAATGERRWERALPFCPNWIGQHADMVLAAGAEGCCGLRLADGAPLWGWRRTDLALGANAEELTTFRLAGPRLFFFQGLRRLFALAVDSGEVLWAAWAPGARFHLPSPVGRFWPRYHADEHWLVVQTTGGQRWILESRTGRRVHETKASADPWPQSPLPLDGRLCLLASPRRIVQLDLASGKETWTHQLTWRSLTGEPPQLVSDGRSLLLVVPRNYGWELDRLDPHTGRSLWRHPRPQSVSPLLPTAIALDDSVVFFIAQDVLRAHALADGQLLWETTLPGPAGAWRTVRAGNVLLVHPLHALGSWTEEAAVTAVLSARQPLALAGLLSSARTMVKDGMRQVRQCLLVCDPRDGRWLQRCNFTATGSQAAVRFGPHSIHVVLGDQAWALAGADGR
jgi:outer membrane protein assembly factor BamB